MSDKMTCMPFAQLVDWVIREHDTKGSVFGVRRPYKADTSRSMELFDRNLETVIGPAAGPNSQLAQNIVASYYAGSRFFELKTVQIMDGAELAACVNKPCIKADDECYNCEWSTELYVPEAQDEYIKAWMLLHVMAKEYDLGAADGFQFNISVGYDLEGIKSKKIDTFIENMKDAKDTEAFREAKEFLLGHVDMFKHVTAEDIEAIPSDICNSATISTLHGCPPQEIESIANYLLNEKGMHTFIKCNPTLLGYDYARKTMDEMGYDYVVFGKFHFEDDLQYKDAVPMLQRLMTLADEKGLAFGVKITNTFPVDVKAGELPSEEMYMSGKSLYALSLSVAAKLSSDFDGKLRIAYSGGADYFNIDKIVGCGIWPVTMATTVLKPGGYQRFEQMAKLLEKFGGQKFTGIDVKALEQLVEEAKADKHHRKSAKMPASRKSNEPVPLMNCYTAPCQDTCPIHQDIPAYVELVGEGKYEEALQVIMDKNALPFMTGTICAHDCMGACTRNFYETPVQIRGAKLVAAQNGYEAMLAKVAPTGSSDKKTAVIGGGPAGMAAAYYLAKGGAKVTIFEKTSALGGVVNHVIPDFRIDSDAIGKDASFLEKLGVEIKYNTTVEKISDLKALGYDAVVVAVGAYKRGSLVMDGYTPKNALEFLEEFNASKGNVGLGKNVVVIGGGNTAMDTARAAKRNAGVEHVYLVYRRTKRYMPADEEELLLAVEDGVEFKELLAPVKMQEGKLVCEKMVLGEVDASGRRGVAGTGEMTEIPADAVIAAVGEKVPSDYYEANGINVDEKGRPRVSEKLETSEAGVYVVGDGLYGPSIVVKAMANAKTAAEAILGAGVSIDCIAASDKTAIYAKKGILAEPNEINKESNRCLGCATVCENCVDVCPNRANISIQVPGMDMEQVIHVDYMCNECGNCNSFCPYSTAPYQSKFTLFAKAEDMEESKNDGFAVLDAAAHEYQVRFLGSTSKVKAGDTSIPAGIMDIMNAVVDDYSYLLM
ncbi:MAG: putative selenate reductase subunit YgfK [Lachnospiraceae bacterium]|nr:putative selenate reductase subunit YgfK [Lachnospiraceae bacterium]